MPHRQQYCEFFKTYFCHNIKLPRPSTLFRFTIFTLLTNQTYSKMINDYVEKK